MEIKRSEKAILFLMFLVFSFLPFGFCSGQQGARELEVRYPHIPGLTEPPKTVKSALPATARYLFEIVIVLSGVACFVAIFSGGVRMMVFSGNPRVIQRARRDIQQVLLGLVIVLGSYLLLKTVNPQLVSPKAGIEVLSGVTVFEDEGCRFDPENENMDGKHRLISTNSDLKRALGFKPRCFRFQNQEAKLNLVLYQQPNFHKRIANLPASTGQAGFSRGAGSVQFLWQYPGIYLCTQPYRKERREWFCNAKEKLLSYSTNVLSSDLKNRVRGLKIETLIAKEVGSASQCRGMGGVMKGDDCIQPRGAVLHQKADNKRRCELIDPTGLREADFMYFAKDLKGENPTFGEPRTPKEGEQCKQEELGFVTCLDNRSYIECSPDPADPDAPPLWLKPDPCPEDKDCCGATDRCSENACLDPETSPDKIPIDGKEPAFELEKTSSLTLFSPKARENPGGVYFCQEPDPDMTREPACYGPYKKIRGDLGESVYDRYTGETLEALPNAATCAGQWTGLGNGISSIVVNGNFAVILFAKNEFKGECQVFKKSDSNLTNDPIGGCCISVAGVGRTDCVSSVIVFPIYGTKEPGTRAPPTIPSCEDQCDSDYMACNPDLSGYKMCGDYDQDACLDWPQEFTMCPEGRTCTMNPSAPCGGSP